jgi:hypothetical protein
MAGGLRRRGHHHAHHGRVAREPTRDGSRHRTHVVELGGARRRIGDHLSRHRDGHVRALAGDGRPVRLVEPMATDLVQRVDPPLSVGPCPLTASDARVGVHHRAQRGQQRFAGLGVEVAVDPHHPLERQRGVQTAPRVQDVLAGLEALAFDVLPPDRRDLPQAADRVDACGLDELLLRAGERARVGLARVDEHARRRHGDVARIDRAAGHRHLLERPRDPRGAARHPPRDLEAVGEPRRRREVTVTLEQAAPLDLGEPPQALGLEQVDHALELGEVLLDARVGKVRERLGAQRLDRGTKLAHAMTSNMCSRLRHPPSRHRDGHHVAARSVPATQWRADAHGRWSSTSSRMNGFNTSCECP